MKKALLILLASTSLIACTKDNDVYPERSNPACNTMEEGICTDDVHNNKAGYPAQRPTED